MSTMQIIGALATSALILLISAFVLYIAITVLRRIKAMRDRHRQEHIRVHCARCGYDLTHQTVPRCPECGALRGFGKSAEELGIDAEIRWKE